MTGVGQLEGAARGVREWAARTDFGVGGTVIGDETRLDMETMVEESGWESEPRAGPPSVSQKGSRRAGSD